MSSGNRSRSSTAESFSSSDNSIVAPLGPDGKPLQGARRRSHRPRGCRGGRKNRKNKERMRQQVPKPRVEQPLSPKINGVASVQEKLHQDRCLLPEPLPAHHRSPSIVLMPPPGLAHHSKAYDMKSLRSSQPSFESSIVSNDNIMATSANSSSSSQQNLLLIGTGDILPPVPTLSTSPKLSGPNPYALKVKRTFARQYNDTDAMITESLPSISTFVSQDEDYSFSVYTENPMSLSMSTSTSINFDDDDENGGSLFATSPRTFLRGGKSVC